MFDIFLLPRDTYHNIFLINCKFPSEEKCFLRPILFTMLLDHRVRTSPSVKVVLVVNYDLGLGPLDPWQCHVHFDL